MREDLEKKKAKEQEERRRQEVAAAAAVIDQERAAAAAQAVTAAGHSQLATVTFEYSNGDVYVGEMQRGKPCGFGKMQYSDDGSDRLENSLVTYEGSWIDGKHHGMGKKDWQVPVKRSGSLACVNFVMNCTDIQRLMCATQG